MAYHFDFGVLCGPPGRPPTILAPNICIKNNFFLEVFKILIIAVCKIIFP